MKEKSRGYEESKLGLGILKAQEEERKRVARELHDSAVQNLTSLIYKAELCSKVLEVDPTRVKLELQIMIVSLKNIIEEMRNTIYDLRPPMIEDRRLDLCIQNYVNRLGILYPNMLFKLEVKETPREVKSVYSITLLRIVQEACQNAIKHADAKSIVLELIYEKDFIEINVIDNGKGFSKEVNVDDMGEQAHFGMSIMTERINLLGGKLKIHSKKNEGTVVSIKVSKVYYGEGDKDDSD